MSDLVPAEFNLLKSMPGLETEVLRQRGQCCWALSIARGVGIRRKIIEEDPHGEVSPQDLLDHIWFYFKEERQKDQDKRGFYQCKHSTAYRFIEEMGACFLEDYAFEGRLDEHRGPIHKTEVPRVFCGGYRKLTLEESAQAIRDGIPVTALIIATASFRNYKEGIYQQTPGEPELGKHSVLIVGVNESESYFIIQNFWGPEWGDGGKGKVHFNSITKFSCVDHAWKEDYARDQFK